MTSESYNTVKKGTYETIHITRDRNVVNGWFTTRSTSTVNASREVIERNSVSTPGWNTRNRPFPPPVNPFSYSRVQTRYGSGYIREKANDDPADKTETLTFGIVGDLSLPTIQSVDGSQLAAADRNLTNDILGKIKDEKVNLLQMFAEREQTARLIGDTAIRLAKAINRAKKGNFTGAAEALGVKKQGRFPTPRDFRRDQSRAMARGWLEMQYGWKPLLDDVYGMAEAVANSRNRPPTRRVQGSTTVTRKETTVLYPGGGAQHVDESMETVTLKYVYYFSASSMPTRTLTELGITNPGTIAWEVLPWSFVIDWFLPVGSFVSAFDATLGLQFTGGSKTTFRRGQVMRTTTYGKQHPGGSARKSGSVLSSVERVTCDRGVLTNFPHPRLPAFKNPLGFEHCTNALALLRLQK